MTATVEKTWTDVPPIIEGPQWVKDLKQKAWERYQELEAPAPLQRNLRKAPTLDISQLEPTRSLGINRELAQERLNSWDWQGAKALFHQGQSIFIGSELENQGVIICKIEDAIEQHPDLVQPFLGKIAPETKANALNLAYFNGGTFVYVPKGVQVELPLYLFQGISQDNQAFVWRHLVVIESSAELTLVDDFYSPSESQTNWISEVTEVHLAANARLHQVALQQWGKEAHSASFYAYQMQRSAHLTALHISSGAAYHENQVMVSLNDKGAEAQLLGLNLGNDSQYFHQNTHQLHNAPHTMSDLQYHNVMKDQSYSFFNGMIYVDEAGQHTESNQVNKSLLLSEEARADAIPNLEIFADDVQSGHGAAVGSLDKDQLFYLMSRGFDRHTAESLLVEGFMESILARFPHEDVKVRVAQQLALRLLDSREGNLD